MRGRPPRPPRARSRPACACERLCRAARRVVRPRRLRGPARHRARSIRSASTARVDPRPAPGDGRDHHVGCHGQQVRPIEAEQGRQHESGEERPAGRADRVDRVQPRPVAPQFVGPSNQVLPQDRQGASHQGGRGQEHQRCQGDPERVEGGGAVGERFVDRTVELEVDLEQHEVQRRRRRDPQLQPGIRAERRAQARRPAPEDGATDGQAQKEDGERRGSRIRSASEQQAQLLEPEHLVDEAGRAGQEDETRQEPAPWNGTDSRRTGWGAERSRGRRTAGWTGVSPGTVRPRGRRRWHGGPMIFDPA